MLHLKDDYKKNWEVFTTEKVPLVTFLNMSNALPIYLLQRDKIVFFKFQFFASLGNSVCLRNYWTVLESKTTASTG